MGFHKTWEISAALDGVVQMQSSQLGQRWNHAEFVAGLQLWLGVHVQADDGWCPFCERVWVILRAKGIPYDEQLISLQNKPSWYKALVPTTLVPAVLFHGDDSANERRIVWESTDILRVLDEEFPDTPKMMHEDDNNFQLGRCSGTIISH